MIFYLTSHKTGQLSNATRKYLLAVQPTGRTNAAEFGTEIKIKQNSASLSPVCFQSSYTCRGFHIEGFTLLMCSGAWSGWLLNSPPIWRSLTQEIESLSSVSFWLPSTRTVWYGLWSLCYEENSIQASNKNHLSASVMLFSWQLEVTNGSIWHITSLYKIFNSILPQPLLRLPFITFIQTLKSHIPQQKVRERQKVWAHSSQIQKEYFSFHVFSFILSFLWNQLTAE